MYFKIFLGIIFVFLAGLFILPTEVIEIFPDAWELREFVKEKVTKMFNWLVNILQVVWNFILQVVRGIYGFFQGMLATVSEKINAIQMIQEGIQKLFS